jgi:hypothetical protein
VEGGSVKEPDRAVDYQERDVKAVFNVLIELGQVLGTFREDFVIVGGAVPWLLLEEAVPPHIGTLDLDLDLDPRRLLAGRYATLIETLERHGYERSVPGLKDFQLRRWVKVDDGPLVAVLIDLLMPKGGRLRKHKPKLVEHFRVLEAPGGAVALQNHVWKKFKGRMPDGRQNEVELLIATIPALLVMKGYALVGRDKMKDAYDVYFSVRHYRGGPTVLAEECRPLLQDEVAVEGFRNIASKFQTHASFGPHTVRLFLEESNALGDMTPAQAQTDAFMQVSAFLSALGLAR